MLRRSLKKPCKLVIAFDNFGSHFIIRLSFYGEATMKKSYYIYDSPNGCFGAVSKGSRRAERYTSESKAKAALKNEQREGHISWTDFEWVE